MPRSGVPWSTPDSLAICGITLRRDSGRGLSAPFRGALTIPPIMGMPPDQPPSPAGPACGTPSRPATGDAVAASRIAGDAGAHDCGTDNPPTVAAWPRLADTPGPYEPVRPPARPPSPAAGAASFAAAGAALGIANAYSGKKFVSLPTA